MRALIDTGKISTQANVDQYVQAVSGPLTYLTSKSSEGVLKTANLIQAGASTTPLHTTENQIAAGDARDNRQMSIEAAQVKSGQELTAPSGSVGAQTSAGTGKVEGMQDIARADLKSYIETLALDPATGNKIKMKNLEEAIAGVVSEHQGFLPGPLKRDPTGAAEFIDAKGQLWDVKKAISRAPNGKYIFNPEHLLIKVREDLAVGENVILDMIHLEHADIPILYNKFIQKLTKDEIQRIIVVMNSETQKFIM